MEEKEIRKDSFSYKVAYGMTRFPPRRENHCRFWRRFIWMFFIGIPLKYLFAGIIIGIFFLISLPFAARPAVFNKDTGDSFVSYRKWPKIKGYRIRPIYLLLPLGLYYFQSFFLSLFLTLWKSVVTLFTLMATNIGLSIIGVIAGIILLIFGLKLLSRTEPYQLTKDYLKAKKDGICPIITFVDVPVAETTAEE